MRLWVIWKCNVAHDASNEKRIYIKCPKIMLSTILNTLTTLLKLFLTNVQPELRVFFKRPKKWKRSLGKFVPIYISIRSFIELCRCHFVPQPFSVFHAVWTFHPFRISQIFQYEFFYRSNSLKIRTNFPSSKCNKCNILLKINQHIYKYLQ